MARLNRLTAAGLPHHLMQRGHNGSACVVDANDRSMLLTVVAETARQTRVQVHAYAVLPEALHWVLTPPDAQAVSQFMQAIGRRYSRYFNARHGRSGALWDGRFRSTVFEADTYMLPHLVYVDGLPLRGGTGEHPPGLQWSSALHHLGEQTAPWLVAPLHYWALGNTPFEREQRYRELLSLGTSTKLAAELSAAVQGGWALGSPAFLRMLAETLDRRVVPGQRGRPRKVATQT